MRDNRALSTVVVALIILVVAVLLAAILAMFAVNVISTRTQQEKLRIRNEAIWVYGNGTSFAVLSIDNIGGRDVLIDKIWVRGIEADWSSVYYLRRSTSVSTSLNCPNETHSWTNFLYTTGTVDDFSTDNHDKPLASADTLVIYIKNPDRVDSSDLGYKQLSIGITVFTVENQYYVECNPKAAERA